MTMTFESRFALFHVEHLFADAEPAKDEVQYIIDQNLASDFADLARRHSQLFAGQFEGPGEVALAEKLEGGLKRLAMAGGG